MPTFGRYWGHPTIKMRAYACPCAHPCARTLNLAKHKCFGKGSWAGSIINAPFYPSLVLNFNIGGRCSARWLIADNELKPVRRHRYTRHSHASWNGQEGARTRSRRVYHTYDSNKSCPIRDVKKSVDVLWWCLPRDSSHRLVAFSRRFGCTLPPLLRRLWRRRARCGRHSVVEHCTPFSLGGKIELVYEKVK